MSIGSGWPQLGAISKDEAFALLDAFWDAGGNYIDTANCYQKEESEIWVGEWMAKRGRLPVMTCMSNLCSADRPNRYQR